MTIRDLYAHRRTAALAGAATGILVLAACGSGGTTASGSGPSDSGSSDSGMTVTVRDVDGMKVLATSSGQTLYVSDQEKGRALCTSTECRAVWLPLTVSAQQQPTAAGGLAHDLGTLDQKDGATQVTFDGRPLYSFSLDHGAGQLNGNGQSDSFGGIDFTWHAATTTGAAPSSDSGYGHGY